MASKNPTFELGFLDDFEDLENVSEINVFLKIFIVSTCTVKRICNLISAETATFKRKNVLLCYKSLACIHPI